jgi:peroxiredoxin
MIRFLALVLMLAGSLPAQDLATEIRSVIDEYENAVRANTLKIINAHTEEEKNQYRQTIPSAGPCATKLMQIIKANADKPEVVPAVCWLVSGAASFPEGEEAKKMLATTYAGSAGIAPTVRQLEYQGLFGEPAALAVLEKNKNREEIAAALYTLGAIHFKNFDASADRASAEASKPKCIDYFQRLNADYSDVVIQGFKLSDLAGKMLFEMTNLQAGSEAPEIEGKDKDGKPLKLSDFRGKHVIVIFWGGWCHACHGILPLMNETAAKFKDKPAAVLGVNTDIDVDAAKALATYQVTFPNILDNTSSGPNTTLYNLRNFPTLYLIDPKGVILLKNSTLDAMVARIEADLAK